MGGLIQLPREAIPQQTTQPVDPLERYGQLLSVQRLAASQQLQQAQIQNAQLDTQTKQLQVAQEQRDAQDQQTMRAQAPNFVQKDDSGKVTGFDWGGYSSALLGNSVSPTKVSAMQKQNADASKALSDSGEAAIKLADAKVDNAYNILEGVRNVAKMPNAGPNTVQGAYQDALPQLQKLGIDTSKYPQNFAQVGDAGLQQFEATLGAHKQIIADAQKQSEIAKNQAAQQSSEAELPGKKAESSIKEAQLSAVQQGGVAPGVPLENQEASSWLKANPNKTLADYMRYKATLPINTRYSLESGAGVPGGPASGGTATPAQVAQKFGMTQEAFDQAAEKYNSTGQLPQMGRGISGIALNRALMNRAGELHPGATLAANSAEFKANQASLSKLQTNFDQVSAFENTAGKNLDLFLSTAKPVVDSGSPWINKPLRAVAAGALGSSDQAAFNAARQTAVTEIAKVLNSSNASGVLSDAARHEVEGLIKPDATLKQIYSAANILKQDMANRHQAYQDQISDIQGRMKGSIAPPVGPQQQQTQPGGAQGGTSGKAVSLAAAKQLPGMAGKSDDEITALIKAQGHEVKP